MVNQSVNQEKLKQIAHANPTATVTMTSLALRARTRSNSDITRTKMELIRQGEKIVDQDYMQVWKDLQDAGFGSIVYGRRGKPDRFEWYYSLKQVGQAAIDNKVQVLERVNETKASPVRVIKHRKGKGGRPKGAKNKPKNVDLKEAIKVVMQALQNLEG